MHLGEQNPANLFPFSFFFSPRGNPRAGEKAQAAKPKLTSSCGAGAKSQHNLLIRSIGGCLLPVSCFPPAAQSQVPLSSPRTCVFPLPVECSGSKVNRARLHKPAQTGTRPRHGWDPTGTLLGPDQDTAEVSQTQRCIPVVLLGLNNCVYGFQTA